jgi:hypothetical protein
MFYALWTGVEEEMIQVEIEDVYFNKTTEKKKMLEHRMRDCLSLHLISDSNKD